jgi:hypothetical protein
MVWGTMRGPGGRRVLLIGLILASAWATLVTGTGRQMPCERMN